MYSAHTFCRACGYAKPTGPPGIKAARSDERLVEVFDLGVVPLANDFHSDAEASAGFAPLKVMFCPKCLLAQLSVVVDPAVLYSHYSYVTSQSRMMFDHFTSLWDCIKDRHPNPDNVLEIGSNDGTFLKFLQENGVPYVLGIDPAENLAEKADANGVRTLRGLFTDSDMAKVASSAMPTVDVVMARHVFCHVDDWHGFVKSLDVVCQKETLVVIEVPYVADLLKQVQFDTIYHEHLSYMNVRAMVALLDGTPFKLHAVQHFPIHAGAIVLYLRRRDYNGLADDSVESYLAQEIASLDIEAWNLFNGKAKSNIAALKDTVLELTRNGKSVCGFGASAKSTVWVQACKFTRQYIKFIVDSTPEKHWKFSPGSDIRICDEGALLRDLPDYAILWAWNYEKEVIQKNQMWMDKGGQFIIPVPSVHIVSNESNGCSPS